MCLPTKTFKPAYQKSIFIWYFALWYPVTTKSLQNLKCTTYYDCRVDIQFSHDTWQPSATTSLKLSCDYEPTTHFTFLWENERRRDARMRPGLEL
ncbi:unnamed protein product [Larinioides sclopetarius]|uniref:Uncharacterized protein n=1 Tax=Larinioides sclopetarius TaxID=280406 RepID=A0AAV1ZLE5_9ARAC